MEEEEGAEPGDAGRDQVEEVPVGEAVVTIEVVVHKPAVKVMGLR